MRLSRELKIATFLLLAPCAHAQAPGLAGTDWQLVRFQSGDGRTFTPDDRAKYTFGFRTGGVLNMRIDCNRGTGSWRSPEPQRLEIGPLAVTRALCPPGSLFDQIAKEVGNVRTFTMKDGRLYLSLVANGGTMELEPIAAPMQR